VNQAKPAPRIVSGITKLSIANRKSSSRWCEVALRSRYDRYST